MSMAPQLSQQHRFSWSAFVAGLAAGLVVGALGMLLVVAVVASVRHHNDSHDVGEFECHVACSQDGGP